MKIFILQIFIFIMALFIISLPQYNKKAAVNKPETQKDSHDCIYPLKNKEACQILSVFGDPRGRDRKHAGVDIGAPAGTPVVAPQDGIVLVKDFGRAAGFYLWILDYRGEYAYQFLHLRSFARGIHKGRKVRKGQVIAYVGNSGNARGKSAHLHFGIARLNKKDSFKDGHQFVDPLLFLPEE